MHKKRFLGFLKMFFEEQQNEWAAGRGKNTGMCWKEIHTKRLATVTSQ